MARASFQVLVLPYRRAGAQIEYAVFRRADLGVWQGIAGGGEDRETPTDAARREAFEEAGIPGSRALVPLVSTAAISVEHFADRRDWDPALEAIPEYSFGVEIDQQAFRLSREHMAVRWVDLSGALALLEWESNRLALRELDARLTDRLSESSAHAVWRTLQRQRQTSPRRDDALRGLVIRPDHAHDLWHMTPRKYWVSSPHSGGSQIPPALQDATRLRILAHAHAHYAGRFREIEVRFRGAFCYIDARCEPEAPRRHKSPRSAGQRGGEPRDAEPPIHLCRLRYFSGRGLWTVAFYTYSHERYEATYFSNGEVHGTPEEALDLGAIYLQ